ncbi:MAG: sigma-70 family RNA polymerase sigma factor [Erysipelotrichaceae bacterium]|nr:sigma-70 family RNA polymerase sigma factor [Erysipelotrichaceae bacterium]
MRIKTETAAEKYRDRLFAAAFHICRNAADADDVVQETLLRYHKTDMEFESEEHLKAWLLRVVINQAKNVNRSFFRHRIVPLEDYMETLTFDSGNSENLFLEVMRLPEKYRIVIHLYYYEEYSVRQISQILGITDSNTKIRLARGRAMLKEKLQEEWDENE